MSGSFTLPGFIAKLAVMAVEAHHAQQEALELSAQLIENRAKAKLGEYQQASGPFVGWAELSDSTKADRVRQGFPENEPELRTGEMRDSIGHVVHGHEAHVGSNSDIALYQELGTAKMPPRSFLGAAAAEKAPMVARVTGQALAAALTGAGVHRGKLKIT